MRYEFHMDEVEVPVELPGCKIKRLDMTMDYKVGVEISEDGELYAPDILVDGKWQRAVGWLATAILETAESPYHEEQIASITPELAPVV